jgi:23S rRNA pseudouridine1911/1915/1917 synthase
LSEETVTVTVAIDDAGMTLEALVRRALGGVPWSRARDLVRSGRVTLEGRAATDPAARVRAGEVLVVRPDAARVPRLALRDDAVVYVDDDVLVVAKAAGTLTVPTEEGERDSLADRARAFLRGHARQTGAASRDDELGVVHRLDRDTSGLVLFARSFGAKKRLGLQFAAHTITREYLAIVHGRASERTHDTTLLRDRGDGLRGSFGRPFPHGPKSFPARPPLDAQRAVTHVEVVELLQRGATLVRCRLETGRQHQIRIHLSEAGTMVVGETVYLREHRGHKIKAPRLMLHATALAFVHPRTGLPLRFELPPPEDFMALLATLR